LRDVVQEIRERGAELVVVGNGRPEQAAQFAQERGLTFPLLVDPSMRAYAAAGLRRGVTDALKLKTVGHALRALGKGFVQARTQGDPWQLGGAFVFSSEGKTLYRHVSREAGDHPDPRALVDALG